MAKDKIEITETNNDPVYNMDFFFEENQKTKINPSLCAGFKTWFCRIKGRSILEKNTIKDWESLMDKYLKEPV